MTTFISICNDLHSTVFSFLLYTESISLQMASSTSLKKKDQMEKHCQHIQPHGKVETYYINTRKKQYEWNYEEGKKKGTQREWYENGKLSSVSNYYIGKIPLYKGLLTGIQKEWYENGQILKWEKYYNGNMYGKRKFWFDNGQVRYIYNGV